GEVGDGAEGPGGVVGLGEAGRHGRAEADVPRRGAQRRDKRGRLEPAQERWMVPGVHDEPVGHEQEVELATLGVLGDLLDDRQVVVAGRRAVVAPSGGVIAGAEHEHAEVHLAPLRRHGEYRPYFFAADMSRLWLTAAVCDAGPRRIGFEMCTSTVGDFTCELAATSAG